MIEVQHLGRRYGEFVAVDDVSFTIQRGEVVGLLGHNGAGKTTIMKMITGFLEPGSGVIRVAGLDVVEDRAMVQARIGYLPENCPLTPELTVIDYLDHQAMLHGLSATERPAAVARAIRRTALEDKARQPIQTLSRGYRQRVGVAQAVLHDPEIVILDEPTNGLDPTQIQHMRELIRDLAKHATVIVSTHILREVQAVCNRVLILNGGRLALDNRLDELERADRLAVITAGNDIANILENLPGSRSVTLQPLADGRLRAWITPADDAALDALASRVARALIEAGQPLFALEPERRDLETIFSEISEAARDGAREVNDAAA